MSCQPSHASETVYPELTESVPSGRSFFISSGSLGSSDARTLLLTSSARHLPGGPPRAAQPSDRTRSGERTSVACPCRPCRPCRPSASSSFAHRVGSASIPDGVWQKTKKRGATSIAPRIGDGWFANARSVRLRPAPLLQAPAVAPSGRLRSDWDGPSTSTRRRARSPKGRSSKRARRSRARGCSKSR